MLPEIDGINVAKYLRKNKNLVPVIALTSLPGDLFRDEALMAGCNGYIEKPFQIEYLETAIKQLSLNFYLLPLWAIKNRLKKAN